MKISTRNFLTLTSKTARVIVDQHRQNFVIHMWENKQNFHTNRGETRVSDGIFWNFFFLVLLVHQARCFDARHAAQRRLEMCSIVDLHALPWL